MSVIVIVSDAGVLAWGGNGRMASIDENIIIIMMFMIIIALAYLPEMFFIKCCLLVWHRHMPNIVDNNSVSSTLFNPINKPENKVVAINAITRFVVLFVILFISSEYHFVLIVTG